MQIFPKQLNLLPKIVAAAPPLLGIVVVGIVWVYFSPAHLQVGYTPKQPVPYSHRLHAGELGMDCRYCHSSVEVSHEAVVPPTQTCMGCHSVIHPDSAALAPIRESFEKNTPVEWVRVHYIPGHAYFNHQAHISVGVGCVSCHGRVDQMEVVAIDQPLGMGWCLDCHRNPEPHLRPKDQVTNMQWKPEDSPSWDKLKPHFVDPYKEQVLASQGSKDAAYDFIKSMKGDSFTQEGFDHNNIVQPPQHCSGCHR